MAPKTVVAEKKPVVAAKAAKKPVAKKAGGKKGSKKGTESWKVSTIRCLLLINHVPTVLKFLQTVQVQSYHLNILELRLRVQLPYTRF